MIKWVFSCWHYMWGSYKYLSYERGRRLKQKRKKGEFCGSLAPISPRDAAGTAERTQLHPQSYIDSVPSDPQSTHRRNYCKLSEGPRVRRELKLPVAEVLLFLVHESLELYHSLKEATENWERETGLDL